MHGRIRYSVIRERRQIPLPSPSPAGSPMARRGRGRKYRRYLRGQVDLGFLLGTLAGNTLISSGPADTVQDSTWVSSVKGSWSLADYTPAASDGPILVGVAHSDYTDAEIEAWVENSGAWSQGDKTSQEVSKRFIRRVGVFPTPDDATKPSVLNDGKEITTKCGWMLTEGQNVTFWAYNMGTSALATTDPRVHFQGHANLWPA